MILPLKKTAAVKTEEIKEGLEEAAAAGQVVEKK